MEFALVHGKKNIREKEKLEKEEKEKASQFLGVCMGKNWKKKKLEKKNKASRFHGVCMGPCERKQIGKKRSWKIKIRRVGSTGFAWVRGGKVQSSKSLNYASSTSFTWIEHEQTLYWDASTLWLYSVICEPKHVSSVKHAYWAVNRRLNKQNQILPNTFCNSYKYCFFQSLFFVLLWQQQQQQNDIGLRIAVWKKKSNLDKYI